MYFFECETELIYILFLISSIRVDNLYTILTMLNLFYFLHYIALFINENYKKAG